MRIITGKARGRHLLTLEGNDVRPTTGKVKESLFSIIQFDLEGRRFLDLFAGSGQIGLEAVSRGAREAVLVDESSRSISVIRENVRSTGLGDSVQVVQASYDTFLRRLSGKFDLAFLDPPYRKQILPDALPKVAQIMNPGGTIICEHLPEEELPGEAGSFQRIRDYRYGKIMLTFYRNKEMTDE